MYVYIVVTIIPVLVVGIAAVSILMKQMRERYEDQVEAENIRVRSILFDITLSMYNSCEPIVTQQDYRDILAAKRFTAGDRADLDSLKHAMSLLKGNTAAISSIGIYTDNPNIPSENGIYYVGRTFRDYEWYRKMEDGGWNTWTCTKVPLNQNQESLELTLVRRINIGSSKYQAYLVLTVSTGYLRNRLIKTNSYLMASVDGLPCFFSLLQW